MPPRWGNRGYRSRPSRSSPGQSRGPVGGSPHGRGGDGLMKKKKSKTQSVSTSDTATGKFTGGTQRPTPKPKPKPDPKPDDDKKTFVDKHKGATTLAVGSGSLLGASLGTRKYKQIQDIRKVNRWSDKVKGRFGKTYTQLGRKVNPALMARTSGQFIPSSIYAKTGHPAGISNWWNKRSSPTHFAGAEKFVNPILKTSAKLASKFLGPASWLISTPANANEDERMAIINEQWAEEKNKENKVRPDVVPTGIASPGPKIRKKLGPRPEGVWTTVSTKPSTELSGEKSGGLDDVTNTVIDKLEKGKDAIITKTGIPPEIVKNGEEIGKKIIKNEPLFEWGFEAPKGGEGKVTIDPLNQSGGVFINWTW